MNRIPGQAGRVVGVRVAASNREHALRQQFPQEMIDLARLSSVPQTGREILQQSQATIRGLEEQNATSELPSR
jgi:hypothetical protein